MSQDPAHPPDRPTTDALRPGSFATVLERNIRALHERRLVEEERATAQQRVAEAVTRFTGSMPFVYLHVAAVVLWVLVNQGLLAPVPRFDQSYLILATGASVEGIFLSTFVLISQNRAAVAANRRAELDLQVNLLSEHEVTRLLGLTAAIAAKLGIAEAHDPSLPELTEHVAPEKVLDRIEEDGGEAAP